MILARDWTQHPFGPPQQWPPDFRVALSLVLNSPESMILAWGPELHFFFNEAYFPLLGPRLPWAMGERFDKVWADAWAQAKPIVDDALAGRTQRFDDLPWKLATDRGAADTWWTFSYSRVMDAGGKPAGVFIFTNETTARVLGEAALRERNERLRLILESARSHAIVTTDVDGRITDWSPGAEAAFGWRADEAVGQPFSMILAPEDQAEGSGRALLSRVADRGNANDERWYLTRAGQRLYMVGSIHALAHDAQNQPSGYLAIVRDETARQQMTSQMVLEIERQRLSLQQMPGFVALLSGPEHVYRYVNDAYIALAGGRQYLGRTVREVFPDIAGQGFYERLDHVYATGEPYAARAMPMRLAGEVEDRYIDLSYQAIRAADGEVIGIFVGGYDVSERLRAERDLAMANATLEQRVQQALDERAAVEEALRQSQKMEAVGQLTGGLAHDFNNLLAGISGSFELIERHLARGRTDNLERLLTVGKGAAKRASALTHRLLAFSRRQTLAPKATDVNRLLADLEDLIGRTVGPHIQLQVIGQPGLWTTLVDPNQLENAVLNLCINARDAMPGGGTLTVATANATLDERLASERDLPPGEYVTISVRDSGVGMPPEVQARAFEPFFTTKPLGEGTGLGLSMIYGFARQSDGQVRIVSAVGQGTTVSLDLPRHDQPAEQTVVVPSEPVAPLTTGQVVMVIDDEPSVRSLLVDVLSEAGYQVLDAGDGPGGLKLMASAPRLDMLVTDVGLPGGLNGRQVAEAARVGRPGLKVLFITGYAEGAVVGAGHLEPGMQLITKPFGMDDLVRRVRAMLLT